MSLTRNIVVIGAGISGVGLALALTSFGIPCTVYELRDRAVAEGGGLTLTPNSSRILDILGVYDQVKDQGWPFEEIAVTVSDGDRRVGERCAGSRDKFGYQAVRLYRRRLLAALRSTAEARGVAIHYGRKFTGIVSEDARGVVFACADGSRDSASLLIGADGVYSRVRRYIAPDAEATYLGTTCVIAEGDATQLRFPSPHEDVKTSLGIEENYLPRVTATPDGAIIVLPQTPDGERLCVATHAHLPDTDRAGWDAVRHDKIELQRLQRVNAADGSDFVRSMIEACPVENMTIWPYKYLPALSSWFSDKKRVVLLGDAAHAMPPTSGQGAAQALEDAYSLSMLLARLDGPGARAPSLSQPTSQALSRSPAPTRHPRRQIRYESALNWWQSYRQERTKFVMEFSKSMGANRAPGKMAVLTRHEEPQVASDLLLKLYNHDLEGVVSRWLDEEAVREGGEDEGEGGWVRGP